MSIFETRAMFNAIRCQRLGIAGELTADDLERLWAVQQGYCLYTDRLIRPETAHLDHITPLNRGGKNTLDNVAFIASWANSSKHDLPLDEWCSRAGVDYGLICANISDVHYALGLPLSEIYNV